MKGLDRTQLKLIAIVAMVCDHIAWGFLDFMTPLAQVMHVVGRLTIPIMCFFIAEGFKKTSNIRAYISRMVCFWIIAMIPFYRFFGDMYGYRQNIMLDLLIGLLVLTVLEHKDMKKWIKVILVALLYVLSMTVGGWPIIPTLYILVFYYVKGFKKQACWICGITAGLVVFLLVAIYFNNMWHFAPYDWTGFDRLYLLGFVLALIPLKFYNGQKGKPFLGRMFFYLFYPTHFLALIFFRDYIFDFSLQGIYILIQVIAMALTFGTIWIIISVRPSKLQVSTLIFAICSLLYTFGFLVEITSVTVEGVYAAIKMEYFGECLLVIGFTMFIRECSHKVVYRWVYMVEIVVSIMIMLAIFTVNENHIFYKYMGLDMSGPMPRVILEYGIGFYLFLVYIFLACVAAMWYIIAEYKHSSAVDKKRLGCIICGLVSVWIPYLVKMTGITAGYEIPSIGIMGAVIAIAVAIVKYGYFDSIRLASENALNYGNEGILVIDNAHRLLFANKPVKELFGGIDNYEDVYKYPLLKEVFEGTLKSLEINNKVYEMRVDPLMEAGYKQGEMLWALDITKHYNELMEVNKMAKHDSLTGLHNRNEFEKRVTAHLNEAGNGAMLILDLDNFKYVNDTYGHQVGDEVLIYFAQVIKNIAGDMHLAGRLGGDEFCMFFKDILDKTELEKMSKKIITDFEIKLTDVGYKGYTTTSIGIAIADGSKGKDGADVDFEALYSASDKALYLSKNSGKNIYKFY